MSQHPGWGLDPRCTSMNGWQPDFRDRFVASHLNSSHPKTGKNSNGTPQNRRLGSMFLLFPRKEHQLKNRKKNGWFSKFSTFFSGDIFSFQPFVGYENPPVFRKNVGFPRISRYKRGSGPNTGGAGGSVLSLPEPWGNLFSLLS